MEIPKVLNLYLRSLTEPTDPRDGCISVPVSKVCSA